MLEVCIVTALTKHTDHLILLGDRESRPKIASEELERNFKMNVSLFERLILNGMKSYKLEQTWSSPWSYEHMLDNNADEIEGVKRNVKGKKFLLSTKFQDAYDEQSLIWFIEIET